MICSVCNQLTAEHQRLTQAYTKALDILIVKRPRSAAGEYTAVRAAAETAQMYSETARRALEQHKRVHANAN